MARLYPPVIEEVLPAFCLDYDLNNNKIGASITIDFNLNRAVAISEIASIVLRLRTISTNKYIVTENIDAGIAVLQNLGDGSCTFQITQNNSNLLEYLNVGQYYKLQLAFKGIDGNIGYWSTVGTIKCVARPTVQIANFNPNDVNIFNNEILGEYIQNTSTGDSSEKVYSYRFQLLDSAGETIADTGVLLHDSSKDVNSNSSTDKFYCYESLEDDETYYLEYAVTTINGLTAASPRYQVINIESIPLEKNLKLVAKTGLESNYQDIDDVNPWEEGVVQLYLDYIDPNDSFSVTGNFVVLRSSSKDNFKSWLEINRFRLVNTKPNESIFYDYTVEQGIEYKYAVQQYNKQGFFSRKVINDTSVLADFEDMYLYDGERQLKIRFNPKVSSFKNDLQEQKIDTIGSKHPFIFRNGNVCYKEFPISGLISFQLDNNTKFFISDDDYAQMNLERFEDKYLRQDNKYSSGAPSKTDLTSDNIMSERYFKLLVLNWLTDGKPKLFRSPTEGNYIVRLLNVSLSPKTELGRMLHEFTCTAYEIADFNYESLVSLGFLKSMDINDTEYQWSSTKISDLDLDSNNNYYLNIIDKELSYFQCVNFKPGDKITLSFSDTVETLEIIIGSTGTYIYDGGKPISKMVFQLLDNDDLDFSRDLLMQTKEYNYQEFDTIASVSSITQMGEELIGPIDNFFEHTVVGSQYNKKDYAEANNVSLYEDFIEISINEDKFIINKYYILNGENYQLANTYNENETYYERVFSGNKLKVTDLLYLQVRRREVIPIYAYYWGNISQSPYYDPWNAITDSNLVRFMVTPYGKGYIQNKSISTEKEYNASQNRPDKYTWAVLSDEEREYAMSIQDIVSFTQNQMDADQFCLFQVYVPCSLLNSDGIYEDTDWVPLYERYPGFWLSGMYDPLLSEWWGRNRLSGYSEYDPTFTIGYADGSERLIDLSKEPKIIFNNIEVPTKLQLGNGVIAEPIYRVQYIDYAVEANNDLVKTQKDLYLQIKEQAIQNIYDYNRINYNHYLGEILVQKYNNILSNIQDLNTYRIVIKMLTETAYNDQISELQDFLNAEKNLVNNIVLQVQWLDADLIDNIGKEYQETYRIYNTDENGLGYEILGAKNSFNELLPDSIELKTVDNYEANHINGQYTEASEVSNKVNSYIGLRNNMDNALSIIKARLETAYDEVSNKLSRLGYRQNVGQYIEALEQEAQSVFFDTISINNNLVPIYNIVRKNKEGNIESLKTVNIFSNKWEEYLSLESYNLLSLGYNNGYIINNINNYSDIHNDSIIKYIISGKPSDNLIYWLQKLNENPSAAGGNTSKDNYEESYGHYYPNWNETNSSLYFAQGSNYTQLKVGQISAEGQINHTKLEEMLDSIFTINSSISFDDLKISLGNKFYYSTLPNTAPQNEPQSIKSIVNEIIEWYAYKENNGKTLRQIMESAKICEAYAEKYKDDLSESQNKTIQNMIKEISNEMNNFIIDGVEVLNKINSLVEDSLKNKLANWDTAYKSVNDDQSQGENPYSNLMNKINEFNNLIEIKNNAINKFIKLRNEVFDLSSNISVSDNIKEILNNQKFIYLNAISQINDIQNMYNTNLENEKNKIRANNAYPRFLQTYMEALDLTEDSHDKYESYLREAENMRIEILPEEYSYDNQKAQVTEAWRNFLDILALYYKIEVKERFG